MLLRCLLYSSSNSAETDVEYNLEVEVSSNAIEQEDTSDEPEDAYTSNRQELAGSIWNRKTKGKRTRRSCLGTLK